MARTTPSQPPSTLPSTVDDLVEQLLLFLGIALFYASWLWLQHVNRTGLPTPLESLTVGVALALSIAVLALRKRSALHSSWAIVGGMAGVGLVGALAGRADWALMLFPICAMVAPVLLGFFRGSATATVIVLLNLWVLSRVPSPIAAEFRMASVVACAGIGLMIAQALASARFVEVQLSVRQLDLIAQLRARQGELAGALKALDASYASLHRTYGELEVARQQAEEASMLREQFAVNVSHELRTPLNIIVGFAETIYLYPEAYPGVTMTPKLAGDIQEIYRASSHLQGLVNDIIDLSRIDARRMPLYRDSYDLRQIITEAVDKVRPLLRQRGLYLRVELPDTMPVVFVDNVRIGQVLLNLLNNAAQYTRTGGVTVSAQVDARSVIVHVKDTGIGIAEDKQRDIFARFRRGEPGLNQMSGTGLGLAISRQFIELHGGRLWLESEVGKGSQFSFAVPLPGSTPLSPQLVHTEGCAMAQSRVAPVVVVDPDASIGDMLQRYLGDRPIVTARDVEQVQALIEEEHPTAVVVNQHPDAAGDTWLGSIGEPSERYGVPIVRCSVASPSWLLRAHGLSGCLTKPVSRASLKQSLTDHGGSAGPILVVDDDPSFVRLMTRLLGTLLNGGEILTAFSGSQALHMARSRHPSVLFLDLLMPGISGLQVAGALRQEPELQDMAIIAVTGTSYADDALQRKSSAVTLTRPGGLDAGSTLDVVRAIIDLVQPRYGDVSKNPSSVSTNA